MRLRSLFFCFVAATIAFLTAHGQPKSIMILHTNDIHADFTPHEAMWVKTLPKPLIGGFKELAFEIDSIRKANSAVLLLDAGDVMTGNPIAEQEFHGAKGGALFEMMNRMGYDAWCPGNHDLDISQENLRNLVAIAHFPTLSANLLNDNKEYPVGNQPFVILDRGGIRVGIIGVISQKLYSLVNQNNLIGIRVSSPVETTQQLVDRLRAQADVLVALTHQGFEEDSALAANVVGLDVIIGGHSHTRLKKPKLIHGVLVAQAGSNCENLGVLTLTLNEGRVVRNEGMLLPLWHRDDRPATALSDLIDSLQQQIDKEYSEVLATLEVGWVRSSGESAIGSFITDAQRMAAMAEVAFTNTHGIRKDVAAGPLTKRDLYEVLPFRNVLTTFQLSGRQLREAMLYHLKERTAIQTAGISCRWKKAADGDIEIVSLEVQGNPIDDDRMYRCAASDFFVGEAKRYIGVEIPQVIFLKQTVFEAVENQVRKAKTISSVSERHFLQVK